MSGNVTTNTFGQKEIVINGKKYDVNTNRFGEEYVVIDGKRVNIKEPLFQYGEKYKEELAEAKEYVSEWCDVFDLNLQGVRDNRTEKLAFTREYGNDISSLDEAQQKEYKEIVENGQTFMSGKNRALSNVLRGTHQVVSLACSMRKFGV